jgi:hypothetical protein
MNARPRQPWRRTGAVLAGFLTFASLSLGTDEILHLHSMNALALSYRIAYSLLGGYVAARLAPYAPIRHAIILGIIGSVLSAIGAIISITFNLGSAWYPIALALTALPTAAAGGALYCKQTRDRERLAFSSIMTPLLFPYTSRLPECGDFQEPDFAAPSSSGSTRPAQ